MTQRMVLMALMPWQPARKAARLGSSIWVMLGVILAQTGFLAAPMTQPQTSSKMSQSCAHGRTHFAFRQAVRAGKVQLEAVHPGVLAALDNFDPGVLAIFLHDGGDQDAVGKHVLALLEFVHPNLKRAVADQFDVFPADDLLAVVAHQFGVAWRDVDDFGSVEADGFGDDGAPTFLEGLGDDVQVGPRRAGGDDKRIGQFQSVNGGGKCRHKFGFQFRNGCGNLRQQAASRQNKNLLLRGIDALRQQESGYLIMPRIVRAGLIQASSTHEGTAPLDAIKRPWWRSTWASLNGPQKKAVKSFVCRRFFTGLISAPSKRRNCTPPPNRSPAAPPRNSCVKRPGGWAWCWSFPFTRSKAPASITTPRRSSTPTANTWANIASTTSRIAPRAFGKSFISGRATWVIRFSRRPPARSAFIYVTTAIFPKAPAAWD